MKQIPVFMGIIDSFESAISTGVRLTYFWLIENHSYLCSPKIFAVFHKESYANAVGHSKHELLRKRLQIYNFINRLSLANLDDVCIGASVAYDGVSGFF